MIDQIGSVFSFFSSWSGGKDSCLAMHRMVGAGHTCVSLFTMIDETGEHSRSHGLHPDVLRAQAKALGLPIRMASASWQDYETEYRKNAEAIRAQGIANGVFGDIDLQPHRDWVERVCGESGVTAHEPLWQESRRELVREFVAAGFKAMIVVVDRKRMPAEFAGRVIDEALIGELEVIGVDACGENGEFHTFVYDGPLFGEPVRFSTGDVIDIGEHSVVPIVVEGEL